MHSKKSCAASVLSCRLAFRGLDTVVSAGVRHCDRVTYLWKGLPVWKVLQALTSYHSIRLSGGHESPSLTLGLTVVSLSTLTRPSTVCGCGAQGLRGERLTRFRKILRSPLQDISIWGPIDWMPC